MKRLASIAAALALTLSACADSSRTTSPVGVDETVEGAATDPVPSLVAPAPTQVGPFAPGRILARFRPDAPVDEIVSAHGAAVELPVGLGILLLSVPAGAELTVASALARNPVVVYAEPDWIRTFDDDLCTHCSTPDDTFMEWKWDLHNDGDVVVEPFVSATGKVDADIDWLEVFDALGTNVAGSAVVGVIDSGVRATHEDLCGKVVGGYDFYNEDGDATDDHGHGTHVSGIVAACADNGVGIAGVAYPASVEILAAKVCSASGSCTSSAITRAILWAVDGGARVLNLSLGGPDDSQPESDALRYAADNDVLAVCAAGNDGRPIVLFPARDPNCMAVSATDWGDDLASYSSYGSEIEVSAPGGDTEDFFLGTSYIASAWAGSDADYVLAAGTSMAAPQVAGLAALLHSQGVTGASTLRRRIRSTADDLGSAGWDSRFGDGRINAFAALTGSGGGSGDGGDGGTTNDPPLASFTEACEGLTCGFTDTSTDGDGAVSAWSWEFGDGGSSAEQHPAHTYSAGGTYSVSLTVTDDGGATDTHTRSVTVSAPAAGTLHVGDLDGDRKVKGRSGKWEAFLTVRIEDADHGPVGSAGVTVHWTTAGGSVETLAGTTDAAGLLTLATGNVDGGSSVIFEVVGVEHASLSYDRASNHDPDGDSDGTFLVVER